MSDANLNIQSSFSIQKRGFFASGQEVWQWWQQAKQSAIAANIPVAEATWLLQQSSALSSLDLRLERFKDQPQIELSIPLEELVQRWQQRIQQRIPVQYLAGTTPWRNFQLKVSTAVLIPRPETELLIDLAVRQLPPTSYSSPSHWADLGTGNGAIALGLAAAFPHATIHAVDCSSEALAIAQFNADAYRLTERIQFYQGIWFEPLAHLKGCLDGMVSNPPYIPSQMVLELQPEVTQHEPHLALDGGSDGLDCIRRLVAVAPDYVRSDGIWLIELMAGQAASVVNLLQANGNYHDIQIHQDLAGIERFVSARVGRF
ncbi:peptide chain release factor N(5)-glutamine methyltransferase [Phormidium sp. CLA17]|uniref:peptide chain release factor N(5)-glutamine methyltransferase n=1 Tax=Leptolyngbya sp. Cla-17 TaxID=2803751 RepID=UPI0014930B0B|nr:peptide chain release factor N(5)-glutamine methyltransferase [Leptolyngbya sp. Cla-17]MBM0741664.1 peptide chain release factor N(5)-glutamine methyltransferase [Leptolyngbya sp. Cla-17]